MQEQNIQKNQLQNQMQEEVATKGTTEKNVHDIALYEGTVLSQRYELKQVYYWGHVNLLYLAYDMALQQEVMIKEFYPHAFCNRTLDKSTVQCKAPCYQSAYETACLAFEKECSIVKELTTLMQSFDVGILKYVDDFKENGTMYFVTKKVNGMTLDEVMIRHQAYPVYRAMKSLTATVSYLHAHGILHLDIKPSNAILMPDGQCVLIDFGTACYQNETVRTPFVSKGFSAPELYQGWEVGTKTDIYSLGALFYYMLSGTAPVAADQRLQGEQLYPLSRMVTVPFVVEDCIERCLVLDQKKRFSNLSLLEKVLRV